MSDREKPDRSLKKEDGVTRRDLLRRGAVVGGTLLWVAPVIQSVTPPAFAQSQSPVVVSCCKCRGFNAQCVTNVTEDQCTQICGGANGVRQYLLNATCVPRSDKEGLTCEALPSGASSIGGAGG